MFNLTLLKILIFHFKYSLILILIFLLLVQAIFILMYVNHIIKQVNLLIIPIKFQGHLEFYLILVKFINFHFKCLFILPFIAQWLTQVILFWLNFDFIAIMLKLILYHLNNLPILPFIIQW